MENTENLNPELNAKIEKTEAIIKMQCKKHIKIYKLHQLGFSNKEVATFLETNVGHVGNALKDYRENPHKIEHCNSIVI